MESKSPLDDERIVTITVLDLSGVVTKKYDPKSLVWKPRQATKTTTSLVASFKAGSFLTHVPSIPLEDLDATFMTTPTPQPTIRWPSADVSGEGDDAQAQVLSTLRFTRKFRRESVENTVSSKGRFLPETCPINISLSRCGKMISLGKANVIISGEKGESSILVPITSTIKKTGMSSPLRRSPQRRSSDGSMTKDSIPMINIKGDSIQFGLKDDAILRVLVSVADKKDDVDHVQEDTLPVTVSQEVMDEESKPYDLDECEVNNVSVKPLEENYEKFLGFLKGSVNADSIKSQQPDLSPLSCENESSNYVAEEEKLDDAPDMPQLEVKEDLVKKKTTDLLTIVCNTLDFDLAEVWLKVDESKHRLLRYHASDSLDVKVREQVKNVYEGEAAQNTKHRLSAALCKLTKETNDVFEVTNQSSSGAEALATCLVSGISVALAVPFSLEGNNITILTFCVNKEGTETQLEGYLEGKGEEIEKIAKLTLTLTQ